MADDKSKIYDSINEADEEGALGKAKAQESVGTAEGREEHFKQNIMMDVAEHPDGQEVVEQSEIEQVIKETAEDSTHAEQKNFDDSSNGVTSSRSIHKDESDRQSVSDSQNTIFQSSDVTRDNVIDQDQEKIETTSDDNSSVEKFSAFELQSVDQQIEEALIGETETVGSENNIGDVSDVDTNSNQINESASVGDVVGVTAFADDPDGDSVIYSLTINPDNAFAIDPVTGVVTVANPDNLDFESASNMLVEVTATSTDGSSQSQGFNIAINDADEFDVSAVTDSDNATNEVSESAAAGASVGVTAFASDADGTTNDVTYSLSSNPGNAFSIDENTGEVTVNDPSRLDFENAQSMQIEVTATSEDGSTSSETFNIAINDADEFDVSAVTDSDNATNEVSETAAAGATVGVTAFANDADGTTNDVTYSLSSNPGNAFSIDADTGEVTVNDPSQLDFENAQSMQIEVTATSEDGSTSSETFNIAINDADEFDVSAVTDSDNATNEVSESAAAGATVGVTAFANDADGTTNDVTYSLSSNPGNAFSIDADTGEVTVANPAALNFENASSMQIEVTATSEDGSSSSEVLQYSD